MYRLMIVDDESAIRNGLRSIIDWADLGIEVSGEAANGAQAVSLLEHVQPDIILTDIKMPQMDGIALLEYIAAHHVNVKVTVLSGYNDFSYVRAAMRSGAVNYLLKPVDTDELVSAMKEIIQTIEQDVKDSMEQRELLSFLQRNTLHRVINNDISLKELREKCEILNLSFDSSEMYVALVSINTQGKERWVLFSGLNICEEIVNSKQKCYIFTDESNDVVLIFKDTPPGAIEVLLETCIQKISDYLGVKSVAAIGERASSPKALTKSRDSALKLLNFQLVLGSNRVFSFKKLSSYGTWETSGFIANVSQEIEGWEEGAVYATIDRLFCDISEGRYAISPELLKYSIIDIISHALYKLNGSKIPASSLQGLKEDVYERLQSAGTLEDLKQLMYYFCQSILSLQSETGSATYSLCVKKALDNINNKYYDPNISLKTMADILAVNAAYLGRLFKRETGEYFSDCLNKKRIAQATNLLASTDMKITDIVEKTGFSSISYFYTVYKKQTGKNPGELRPKP